MKNIGFIGVGVMGKSMVRNLMKHGYSVSIYARNKDNVQDILAEGLPGAPALPPVLLARMRSLRSWDSHRTSKPSISVRTAF